MKIKNITTGIVRIAKEQISRPCIDARGLERYGAKLLLPKSDLFTIQTVNRALAEAAIKGFQEKWYGLPMDNMRLPINDADTMIAKGEDIPKECANCFMLEARNKYKPPVVDLRLRPIDGEHAIHDGVFCCVSLSFYPYVLNERIGIGCYLGPILKVADGERIWSRSPAEIAFGSLLSAGFWNTEIREKAENPVGGNARAAAMWESFDVTSDFLNENDEAHNRNVSAHTSESEKSSNIDPLHEFMDANRDKKMSLSEFKKLAEVGGLSE
jgi:hypothetical protein